MSELQHPDARSFEQVAELYERRRPTYPEDAVDWLLDNLRVGPASTVLDLGAGTGKLSRQLVPRVARVLAVEPGPEMLAQLRQAVPDAEALLGAAESIPLGDDSVDAVLCGQSFHWFRLDEALPEIRRVLRPDCGLGLIWNNRDQDDELQRRISALIEPFVPKGRSTDVGVRAFVTRTFSEVAIHELPFAEEMDADAVVERIGSISFVVAAGETAREQLLRDVRALVDERGGRVPFRYVTESFVTFAV